MIEFFYCSSPWITGSTHLIYNVNLKYEGILIVGTVRSNCIAGCPLQNDKTIKSKGRGYFDYSVDTENKIVVKKWLDNKIVHVI